VVGTLTIMAKVIEMCDRHYLIKGDKNDNFSCELENKRVKLGLMCEIIDLGDISNEYADEIYPYVIECSIVPLEYGKKFVKEVCESGGITKKEMNELNAYMYAGGIPVNMSAIKGEDKTTADFEMRTQKHATFGNEIKVPHFRTEDDAVRYIKDIYAKNVYALFGMVGFWLDNPVNKIGRTGWDIIEHQVNDKELKMF